MNKILIGMLIVMLIASTLSLYLYFKTKKQNEIEFKDVKINKLMSVLDETIKREFMYKYKLEYELKDLRIINDFGKELEIIVTNILVAFNKTYFKQIEMYYNKDYIIKYVTKNVELMLIEFTREKKIKTK